MDGNMQFDNQGDEFGRAPSASGGFDLTAMLIKSGITSSVQGAQYILAGVAVVAMIAAVFFFVRLTGAGAPPPPPPPNMAPISE